MCIAVHVGRVDMLSPSPSLDQCSLGYKTRTRDLSHVAVEWHPNSLIYGGDGVELEFEDLAAENADECLRNDPLLWTQFRAVLTAIRNGDARARERPLDDGAGWAVTVRVPGRDDRYSVLWAPIAGREAIYILHLGRALF